MKILWAIGIIVAGLFVLTLFLFIIGANILERRGDRKRDNGKGMR